MNSQTHKHRHHDNHVSLRHRKKHGRTVADLVGVETSDMIPQYNEITSEARTDLAASKLQIPTNGFRIFNAQSQNNNSGMVMGNTETVHKFNLLNQSIGNALNRQNRLATSNSVNTNPKPHGITAFDNSQLRAVQSTVARYQAQTNSNTQNTGNIQ